jgi:hypothetical protein
MAKRRAWSEWARARYSWADIARDWLALFRDVERQKHGARPVLELSTDSAGVQRL